jgi:hypothetical protein
MAKKPKGGLEGSTSELPQESRTYDDETVYNVKLKGLVNWPEGTSNYLKPEMRYQLKGKVLNTIDQAKIEVVNERGEAREREFVDRPKTNLTNVQANVAGQPDTEKPAPESVRDRLKRTAQRLIGG